jgi:hypothetical protein
MKKMPQSGGRVEEQMESTNLRFIEVRRLCCHTDPKDNPAMYPLYPFCVFLMTVSLLDLAYLARIDFGRVQS